MNILWMTLLAGIGLALAAALQFKDMKQDQWWQAISRLYVAKKQEMEQEFQRQQFHQIKREAAYLGENPKASAAEENEAEEEISEPTLSLTPSSKDLMLHRIKLYPLNTRLPFSRKLYFESPQAGLWQGAWWRLLDKLYGSQDFYLRWRQEVDSVEFLRELSQQIQQIANQFQGTGTWGLSLVHFQDEKTQQVWYQMLKGSDRLGVCYPSLMGYIWPTELVKGVFVQRLNVAHANFVTMEATFGKEFSSLWAERVLGLKMEAQQYFKKATDLNAWVLTRKAYEELFSQVCKEVGINFSQYKEMADFSTGPWVHSPEILLRSPQNLDQIFNFQVPQRKQGS